VSYVLILTLGTSIGVTGTHVWYGYVRPCSVSCLSYKVPVCDRDIQRASVKVECMLGGHGSGTVGWWNGNLYVLTAAHVAEEGEVCLIGFEKDGKVDFEIKETCVHHSHWHDLALLRLDCVPAGPWPPLAPVSELFLGEQAVYCGWGAEAPLYLEKAYIQNARLIDFQEYVSFLVGGNGQPGNSGSSVWVHRDGHYQLAGVILRGWRCGAPIICIHPTSILDFLEKSGV
jgi:hypothetical protein